MNVLIFGQHGTEHKKVISSLEKYVEESLGGSSMNGVPLIQSGSIEDEDSFDLATFLQLPTDDARRKKWNQAALKILTRFKKEKPRHRVLSMHGFYYLEGERRFFSTLDWELLVRFQPDLVITLIDDIYDIWGRIKIKQKDPSVPLRKGNYPLSVILNWRQREISLGSMIAKHLYLNPDFHLGVNLEALDLDYEVFRRPIKHYVISIKQSVKTLYELLFSSDKIPCYASFPISAPRRKMNSGDQNDKSEGERIIKELNEWRHKIHQKFIVFDPLGIDELRFGDDFKLTKRLPFFVSEPMVEPVDGIDSEMKPNDLRVVREAISDQIRERDFQLVEQCKIVFAWRPLLGKKEHGGVSRELSFAQALEKMVISYHPKEDDPPSRPFPSHIGYSFETEEKAISYGMKIQLDRRADA